MSAAEHPDTAEGVFYRAASAANVAANAAYAANVEALRAVYEAARAEGEAAGRAAERADVVAMLRNAADEVGGVWMADVADGIEAGAHVGAAGGAR